MRQNNQSNVILIDQPEQNNLLLKPIISRYPSSGNGFNTQKPTLVSKAFGIEVNVSNRCESLRKISRIL